MEDILIDLLREVGCKESVLEPTLINDKFLGNLDELVFLNEFCYFYLTDRFVVT